VLDRTLIFLLFGHNNWFKAVVQLLGLLRAIRLNLGTFAGKEKLLLVSF
jgi:hypothetical protein